METKSVRASAECLAQRNLIEQMFTEMMRTKRMRRVRLYLHRGRSLIQQREALLQEETASKSQWLNAAKFISYSCLCSLGVPRWQRLHFHMRLHGHHTPQSELLSRSVTCVHNTLAQGSANYHLRASHSFF